MSDKSPKDTTLKLDNLPPIAGRKSIYIIRHGHTKYNESGAGSVDRIRGWIDVPLDAGGREDAEIIGELAKNLGIEVLVTSDLKRSEETAEIIGEAIGTPVSAKTVAFRPWNLGDLQGQPTLDVLDDIRHYINEAPDETVPGGESFNEFKKRFLKGLHSITDLIDKGRVHRVGIVTHFRGLKMADAWAEAGGGDGYEVDVDHFTKNDAKPGAILELTPKADGTGWEQNMIFRGFENKDGKAKPAGAGS